MARPNARVLPDPVGARPQTSWPARAGAMAAAWIGNGWVLARWVRHAHRSSATPSSAKVLTVVVVGNSVPVGGKWARRARSVDLSAHCSFPTAQQNAASRQRGVAGRSVIVRTARRPRSRRHPVEPGRSINVSGRGPLRRSADRLEGQRANLGLANLLDDLASLGIAVDVLLAREGAELKHDLVGDLPQHAGVVGPVGVLLEVHAPRELDADRREEVGL